jgi:sugar phosphate isomerase/epimerase
MQVAIREPHLIDAWGSTVAGANELGVKRLEITVSREKTAASPTDGSAHVPLVTNADVDSYKRSLDAAGLSVTAMLLYNDFGAADWDAEIDWLIWATELGDKLGATLRVDPIMSTEGEWPLDQRIDRAAQSIRRIIDATPGSGVAIAMENHGSQGNQPAFLDAVMAAVGSPRLGMNIDTANFYWYGHPLSKVHEILRHFAPFAKHTHVKNINFPIAKREIQREMGWGYGDYVSPLRQGDIDLHFVAELLRLNGYKGDLCIEDESLVRFDQARRQEVLRDDVDYVESLL